MRVIHEGTITQMTFLPLFFQVNCYFVEEEEGLTLIDAALPYSSKGIIETANKIGKPITRIVLTHAHGDHVGALDALKRILPNVQVYISKRDSRLLAGDCSLNETEPQLPIKGGVPKKIKTTPDVLLNDGDKIGSLVSIAVPGHTPGSMAFFDTRNGSMIAGDAIQIRGGINVSGQYSLMFPFPALATWNKHAAVESAKKIREFQPSLLAVGHGDMLRNPMMELEQAIIKAENNLMKR
ncbi:MBL fold metallo-hydrolase [Bacillus sp. T3]|uniref:MBL fold metallo-hydrolase n=1 Tax=Bacillus sp. T3 TaxID=467262 RepID=UPI00298116B1|nr:MBL fold metallo-hydrolase [Bacillus sp. T3]